MPFLSIATWVYRDNTSTWQKYTPSDFNYSIQYPSYIQIVPITENYFEGEKYLERDISNLLTQALIKMVHLLNNVLTGSRIMECDPTPHMMGFH